MATLHDCMGSEWESGGAFDPPTHYSTNYYICCEPIVNLTGL